MRHQAQMPAKGLLGGSGPHGDGALTIGLAN